MKYTWALALLVMAVPALAQASVKIANCDDKPYDVIITNAGTSHVVSFSPLAGSFEEQGNPMMMTLQIRDKNGPQPVVQPTTPGEEYCIWGGRIIVQRLNTTNATPTGNSLR